ncbi:MULTISPECIES: DUF4366 domain-containing protein [Clostridia]|uniref:Uncharacterized protein DUF4366 n=1 Tax=Faecalicatena orotica TaxID=1544 RepID=A0A2Y9BL41_9FIRM|nr:MULTISPECIES: DUF4366 domain-containing protein [Clostridia]MDY4784204.1 DUF4366 domain-containing protein [Pygmaiobacter massiliensis]PWJ22723.1 uncharacterized protein DUF4366 [Faecalicatena orotica]SSA58166.1 protein of unknown function [Faecalicatena orotica]
MKKTKIRIFAVMIMTVLCFTAFSATAFASGGCEDTTAPKPEQTETPSVPLTPEGNLTLVDDLERTDEIDKQFITAVSKNGNYFYLVIDRASKEDNVYLLNMVDEADLLALMEDGTVEPKVCSCTDKCEVGAVNADCPVCSTDKTKCTGKAPEVTEPTDEPQPEKEKSSPMGILALLLVFGLVGGGAFYYFKVVKNKAKPQSNPNVNEYDYSDDDDDEEYEPVTEEQEDFAEESEDDV